MQISNPCTRCGKERVDAKTWKEYVGKSLVTFTSTVCPDKECQKIVDAELAAKREKKELLIAKSAKKPPKVL